MSKLINPSEIPAILRESKARYTVIDNTTGQVYYADAVKNPREIDARMAGKNSHKLDGNGLQEFFNTSSWVNSPSQVFKNWWDSHALKRVKTSHNPLVELFMERYESLAESDRENLLSFHFINGPHVDYIEVKIEGFPFIAGIAKKTAKVHYIIYKGKKIDTI